MDETSKTKSKPKEGDGGLGTEAALPQYLLELDSHASDDYNSCSGG